MRRLLRPRVAAEWRPVLAVSVGIGFIGGFATAMTLLSPLGMDSSGPVADIARGIGEALLGGAVIAGLFTWAEARMDQTRTAREEIRELRLQLSMSPSLRGIDLAHRDLRNAYLVGKDLADADLTKADLRGANLRGATLTGARMAGAVLEGADFSGADLSSVMLADAQMTGALFTRADLTRADLQDAIAIGANFVQARLPGANLARSRPG